MQEFPYGRAPFWILVMAVLAGVGVLALDLRQKPPEKPDLLFVTFAKPHYEAYMRIIGQFEERHGVNVEVQLVDGRALKSRMQSAMMTGSPVADLAELPADALSYFAAGPIEDVGVMDLTQTVEDENLRDRMVASRFALWSSRGHIFAIPHDVHPVTLAYRADIFEELGIDPEKDIKTWDDFSRIGRQVTRDLDGDGVIDRFMFDMPASGSYVMQLMARQRGMNYFDGQGRLQMQSEALADTLIWCVKNSRGEGRITFDCGWGQTLSKAMVDGLVLCYVCPDWRTKTFENDVPELTGKMKLMPLPAWEEGGRRTSTWGGTGMAITKACEDKELAWELVKFLYFDGEELASRYEETYIIPPVKAAWEEPEFAMPVPFYSEQKIGLLLTELARETPPEYRTPWSSQASGQVDQAFLAVADYYEKNGDEGLREFALKQLKEKSVYVERLMERNVFLNPEKQEELE
ncbi:MAG: extracellular solute-binding protein [Candidatus Sumerlaeota bacterium]